VTTDRTRTLCLIPQCSCAKNTSLLHVLFYFILYGFVVRSFAAGPTEPLANTLRLDNDLLNFNDWYDFIN
jgi:hypothetical protein